MTTDATTSLRLAARAAGHSRASGPETPTFVATLAADPIAPVGAPITARNSCTPRTAPSGTAKAVLRVAPSRLLTAFAHTA